VEIFRARKANSRSTSSPGAAVGEPRLGGADGLPGVQGLAEDLVDGLGERGAGLVRGHVQQADRVAGQDLVGVARDRGAVVLPADAAHPEAGDLVAALAGEQPGQRDRPHQFQRVEVPRLGLREVGGLQVQPSPHELGPDVVGDHARVGAEQHRDAARDGQRAGRVEAPGNLLPFLQVAEERAEHGEVAGLGGRFQRLAELARQPGGALDVVADLHPVDRGDPGGAGLPGPGRGVGGLRLLGFQPPAGLQQRRAEAVPDPGRERRPGAEHLRWS
jgi:hypothetical protein